MRALAIEAFYSDFVAPGRRRDRRVGGDRLQHASRDAPRRRTGRTWGSRERATFDVVVVGSGAGGGVVAGELADRGRSVLLLEAGPHRTAADFTRWEAKANHDIWWPLRFAPIDGGAARRRRAPRRTVRRRHDDDQHEGRAARGRPRLRQVARGERPRRSRRSAVRRVRPRPALRPRRAAARRPRAVRLAQERLHRRARLPRARLAPRAGARVHGRELHELRLVPAGLPDERRQVDDEHLHPRRVGDRAGSSSAPTLRSSGSLVEDGEATGVEYVDGDGARPARRRGRRRRRRRNAQHAAAPPALRPAGHREHAARRAQPRLPSRAPRLRALRRAAGRAHGLPDLGPRDGPPARRGRGLRDRGDDDPGSDQLRHDARGRERAALGDSRSSRPCGSSGAGSACSRW